MIKVLISKQANYPISSVVIRKKLQLFLKKAGIVSDSLVTVSFVGEAKMLSLAKNYYKDNKLHNVFSFVESEVKGFKDPTIKLNNLGEIVVCFPVVVKEANQMGVLIEDRVWELVEHGAMHLMGIHHKE